MTWELPPLRALAPDLLVLGGVAAGSVALARHTGLRFPDSVDRVLTVLGIWVVVAAVILLALAAWLLDDAARARPAVGLAAHGAVLMPLRDADLALGARGPVLLAAITLAGLAALVGLAHRPRLVGDRFGVAAVAVVAAAFALAAAAALVSYPRAADGIVVTGSFLLSALVVLDHLRMTADPLVRRVGLAVCAYAVATAARVFLGAGSVAAGMELAAAVLLLWAGTCAAAAAGRAVWQERPDVGPPAVVASDGAHHASS